MKFNPTRYSSAVGEIWVMATFKAKYCHKIFDNKAVRQLTDALFHEAFVNYKITCRKLVLRQTTGEDVHTPYCILEYT